MCRKRGEAEGVREAQEGKEGESKREGGRRVGAVE